MTLRVLRVITGSDALVMEGSASTEMSQSVSNAVTSETVPALNELV